MSSEPASALKDNDDGDTDIFSAGSPASCVIGTVKLIVESDNSRLKLLIDVVLFLLAVMVYDLCVLSILTVS